MGFRLTPTRLEIGYIALSVLAITVFALPLWYAWKVNIETLRVYVEGNEVDDLVRVFNTRGERGLVDAMESRVGNLPGDEVVVLADASGKRLAGNLPVWPPEIPAVPGTYGLVVALGDGSTMRVVATYTSLPGGYRLLIGRESARFQSLVRVFWGDIVAATAVVLLLGVATGWLIRRAILSEVDEIGRTASAIAEGDYSRRVPIRGGSDELEALGSAVNGMLDQLATQNSRLEVLVAQRTAELAQANESLKRALGETERQKAHLDELFDLAPEAIVLTTLRDPRNVRVNKEFTRMFGYTAEEAVGRRLRELVAPDDVQPANLTENADLLAGRTFDKDVIRQRKDGTRFHAHLTAKRIRLPDTEDAAYIMYRDITAAKRDEEALRMSEARYARAMEATEAGHWEWDLRTDTVFHSQRFRELHGASPDEQFSSRDEWKARQRYLPGERERQDTAIRGAIAGPIHRYELDIQIAPRPGEVRWLRSRGKLFRDEAGQPVLMAGTSIDVTAYKLAEEALRLSEERYARAMEASDDGVWEWNLATDHIYASPRARRLFGVPDGVDVRDRADLLAHGAFHPDDRKLIEDTIRECVDRGCGGFEVEYRVTEATGSVRWIRSRGKIFPDADGRPALLTGSLTDITERRKAEEERKRAEVALGLSERKRRQTQRLEAMGTLAGGIAHDFNNILGAILGYGEMALRDAPPGSRLRRDLDSILTAGERGRALVDRVLTFSRSGVGERIPVHVEKVVREALGMLEHGVPEGIRVEAELDAGRAAMLGEPTQVHQVLMNLATNAIQAMPAGGTLRVSLRTQSFDAERIATIGTIAAADYIILQVADSGTGIAPEILDRIFDPFFTTKEVNVGNGLGLSLVHGIVAELGGAIDVVSTPGSGSAFKVYLPRTGDAPEASPEDTGYQFPRGNGARVIVVDDEEPLVGLTTERLRDLGYEPTGFTSSTAALEAFRADPDGFDAVITDERMPGMSGATLIREVRRVRQSIPILLVSGYVGGMVTSRAYNEGADEVLKKPLSMQDLAASLARVLRLA